MPWEVPASARGRVNVRATIGDQAGGPDFDTANNTVSDSVVVDASGFSLWDAYAFPNPSSDPADFRIHFQLSQPAYARITIATITGNIVGDRVFYYEVGDPADRTQPGDNQFTWRQIAGDASPASGLYVATIQAGTRQGDKATTHVSFAIRR